MGEQLKSRWFLSLLLLLWGLSTPLASGGAEYHTPLAGKEYTTLFAGRPLHIPSRDRGAVSSLTLGGSYYDPPQGDSRGEPLGALYVKRIWPASRTRSLIGVFVNDLEYDRSAGGGELVLRLENNTLPVSRTEVVDNREIRGSDLFWGTVWATAGPGIRLPVAPYEVDNDLRLQVMGRVGYFYAGTTSETAPEWRPAADTLLTGGKLRVRYDGLRRNLLELPHTGVAAGGDLDYFHREKWRSPEPSTLHMAGTGGRDYFQISGYVLAVGGVPGLSEKNRLLASMHAGGVSPANPDRFTVLRIGGGPLPNESDDLYRPDYPGALFDNLLVSRYAIGALEYRRELTFFIYLHLRSTFIAADLATRAGDGRVRFQGRTGVTGTVAIDSGFFWKSQLYLAYSRDSGFIRDGEPGGALLVTWNKAF